MNIINIFGITARAEKAPVYGLTIKKADGTVVKLEAKDLKYDGSVKKAVIKRLGLAAS